jgi:hypothetical protein
MMKYRKLVWSLILLGAGGLLDTAARADQGPAPATARASQVKTHVRTYPNGTRTRVSFERYPDGTRIRRYASTYAAARGSLGYRYKETEIQRGGPAFRYRKAVYAKIRPEAEKEALLLDHFLSRSGNLLSVERGYFRPADVDRSPGGIIRPQRSWHFSRDSARIRIHQPRTRIRKVPRGIQGWRGITRGRQSVETVRDPDGRLKAYSETFIGPVPGGKDPAERLLYRRVYERTGDGYRQVYSRMTKRHPRHGTQNVADPATLGIRLTGELPEAIGPGQDTRQIDGRLPRYR